MRVYWPADLPALTAASLPEPVKFDFIGGPGGISIPCLPGTTVNGIKY